MKPTPTERKEIILGIMNHINQVMTHYDDDSNVNIMEELLIRISDTIFLTKKYKVKEQIKS